MQSAAAAEAKRQLAEVADIEERARSRVAALVEDHDRALRRAEDYYSTDELATVTKLQARVDNKLSAAEQENRRLSESLQEARRKLPELQKRQQDFKQAKSQIVVQQERDELLRKQTDAILDVQQRSGLKHLLLDRKLAALTDAVEKKEAQLCAALSASGEYDDLLRRCSEKLKGSGVPLYDFPFRPSERLLGDPTRVQDPPGPASAE
ncbi:Growth arrest-specific protein 8 [Liparis tanakae]|uniref:Dynein regulatory complex subunit 4 n=1 Tax=Liparis tanakae TaxID=230148 RepID=A0A4Z2H788_9TELE|nr:Growth arrest-specific protein 8 [Liparis tanakae]